MVAGGPYPENAHPCALGSLNTSVRILDNQAISWIGLEFLRGKEEYFRIRLGEADVGAVDHSIELIVETHS